MDDPMGVVWQLARRGFEEALGRYGLRLYIGIDGEYPDVLLDFMYWEEGIIMRVPLDLPGMNQEEAWQRVVSALRELATYGNGRMN